METIFWLSVVGLILVSALIAGGQALWRRFTRDRRLDPGGDLESERGDR